MLKVHGEEASLTAEGEKNAPSYRADRGICRVCVRAPRWPWRGDSPRAYQGEISRKDQQGIFQMKDGGQWYVYSQFEEIWARRAYPCFDEPGYKVPWQVTLHIKKGHKWDFRTVRSFPSPIRATA